MALQWLTRKEARDRFGFSAEMLRKWESGCPSLGGRKINVRIDHPKNTLGYRGKSTKHYREDDLQRIWSAQTVPRAEWVSLPDASRETGITHTTLSVWVKLCPWLGRPIRSKVFKRPDARGCIMDIRHVWRDDLDSAMKAKDGAVGGSWLLASEATQEFGFSRGSLEIWREDGCPYLGGVKLRCRHEYRRTARNRRRKVFTYHRPQLQAISRKIFAAIEAYSDAYMTVSAAAKLHSVSPNLIRDAAESDEISSDMRRILRQSGTLGRESLHVNKRELAEFVRRYKAGITGRQQPNEFTIAEAIKEFHVSWKKMKTAVESHAARSSRRITVATASGRREKVVYPRAAIEAALRCEDWQPEGSNGKANAGTNGHAAAEQAATGGGEAANKWKQWGTSSGGKETQRPQDHEGIGR